MFSDNGWSLDDQLTYERVLRAVAALKASQQWAIRMLYGLHPGRQAIGVTALARQSGYSVRQLRLLEHQALTRLRQTCDPNHRRHGIEAGWHALLCALKQSCPPY
ncbi:MAG: hypothetical protein KC462_05135 [Cyanobacteria bacterium HKST-UBA05]|nr:hypothetical protein [Cyanobacteria bacterium HKST-UBA05]